MTIVFEAYAPAGTSGTMRGRLPQLRSRMLDRPKGAMIGKLPSLRSNLSGFQTTGGSMTGRLPQLRSRLLDRPKGAMIGKLPQLRSLMSGAPIPSANAMIGALPPLRSNFRGYQTIFGTMAGTLPGLRSRMLDRPKGAMIGKLPQLRSQFYANRGNSLTCILSPGYLFAQSSTTGTGQILQDGVRFATTITSAPTYLLREALKVGDAPDSVLEALAACGETLGFAQIVGIAYQMLVAETLALEGSPSAWVSVALQLADTLALAAGAGSTLNAQVAVATAFALHDLLARVYPETLAETLALADVPAGTLQATLQLLDAMRVQGQPSNTVTFLAQCAEDVAFDGAACSTAVMLASISEGLGLLAQITIDDATYLAWVVNTESRAFVKYRNFPFNSFAKVGERYFGASADGIYALEGDDDAGEPINALLRGALSDLGSSRLKRMHSMYLGHTTDGRMVLKVTAMNADGDREEHWYSLEPRTPAALSENRIKIGKGLKSTYWGWELANVDGADFALDQIAWYPMVLDRRLS